MTTDITDPSLDPYIAAALSRKAYDIVMLDVNKLTSIADTFIICSGRSNRQVTAIAEHIHTELKKQGIRPLSTEGISEGHWALLDYGHVVIHVFYRSVREFYDLEGLWADARQIKIPNQIAPDETVGDETGDDAIEEEAEQEYEEEY